ncbi:MAG: LysM peptidoglycan-binding domain-containing protein [Anaerolineae bacterium]
MKRIKVLAFGFPALLMTFAAAAQTPIPPPPPSPVILGPVNVVTPTPRPPESDDPRPALCSAPFQTGWQAHVIETGDTLSELLGEQSNLSVTQLAALNCLDDPSSLPVGGVIWLPPAPADAAPTHCMTLGQYTGTLPCLSAPQQVTGAQQLFEGGMMIWRQDTGKIWVIDNDGMVLVFNDTYREGDSNPTATAPNGLFVPSRGFGKVWMQLPGNHEPLGWATSFESQITLSVQAAGRVSYTTYIQLPDENVYALTLLPGQATGWWVKLTS